jgi:hypothetical protein
VVGLVGGLAGVQVVFRVILSLGITFGSRVLSEVIRKR